MINTRSDLKLKVKKWVSDRAEPFRTEDVLKDSDVGGRLNVTPHRLQNYIRSSGQFKFNKVKRVWEKLV